MSLQNVVVEPSEHDPSTNEIHLSTIIITCEYSLSSVYLFCPFKKKS